jgi:hypothetical protein
MNKKEIFMSTPRLALAIVGVVLCSLLSACEKKEKKATAGGGASTQGILTIQGAGR